MTTLTYRLDPPDPDEVVTVLNGYEWHVCVCGASFEASFTTPIGQKRLATRRAAWFAAHAHRVMEMDG